MSLLGVNPHMTTNSISKYSAPLQQGDGALALSSLVGETRARARDKQNWVLDPVQDLVFIIAAPLLMLGLAVLAMHYYGAAQGAAMVIMAHVVLTVAHHMPTFIRIYGDLELFQRFKWNFLLGPVIPLGFSAGVLVYLNYHQYPVEYFLYLYIFLALWDPWHFLRQHYGFMRIYDRNNRAPAALASNMDWAICGVWFLHIMLASADWIPGLLEDLHRTANITLLLKLPDGLLSTLQGMTWWLAVFTTAGYAVYLVWCVRRSYYVSAAKLGLLVCTFGVMYFTYTPNSWILHLVPAWGFTVGFATVGIVHMTQYMAIVWRYDRRIAQQGRVRANWFQWLHSRRTPLGVALAAGVYVIFCIAYGNLITTTFDNRWLMSTLLAVGFTSTLMHYYFDGFMWRFRHQQNREALGLDRTDVPKSEGPESTVPKSTMRFWWQSAEHLGPGPMFLRQLVYFGVPMAVLTWGALNIWHTGNTSYVQRMYQAQTFSQQGQHEAAADEAREAYASMQAEFPFAEKMVGLKPNASNQAQLAFLVYNHSLYHNLIMPALAGFDPTYAQQVAHLEQVRRAVQLLQNALANGGDLGHPGRDQLSHEDARNIVSSWQRMLL